MTPFIAILLSIYPLIVYSSCNNFYQASGPSSTKRPFDICYHSERDREGIESSYRYYCIESTASEYGNNSVSGFTAFREDFASTNCEGIPTQTRIVSKPYRILCKQQSAKCDILRFRQHPIINATKCTYNESIYREDIEVIGMCDDNGAESEAIFCNKHDHDSSNGNSYFWSNRYYGGLCEPDRLFEATYQFHGCLGDGDTYLQILTCDTNSIGVSREVKPFQDGTFVAGFVLLLIAIITIICILVWYCCWFKAGFNASGRNERIPTVSVRHNTHDHDDYNDDDEDEDHVGMNTQTR